MKLERIVLRQIRMPLVHFFETSFGRTYERDIILVEATADGVSGWGEVTAGENPFYNEEWTDSAWPLLAITSRRACSATNFRAPKTWARSPRTSAATTWRAADWKPRSGTWKRGCARSRCGRQIGGGARREIPCGVSIGIQDSVEQLLEKIETELAAGYQRIKMKIKPGWDVDVVRQVRERFPADQADGRRQLRLHAGRHRASQEARRFYLMMIEQPLAHDDIIDHAELQAALETPICLDECIRTAHHAEQAIQLEACGIINIKLGRVGGFAEAKRVHDVVSRTGFRCGAAACSKRASAARTISRWPRCRISCCRATFPPASATGSGTSHSAGRGDRAGHDRTARRAGFRLRSRPRVSGEPGGAARGAVLIFMFKPSIFREYDIRGIADEELLDADVELLGRALGTYLDPA